MIIRAAIALFAGVPFVVAVNYFFMLMTYFSTVIIFGCFAPEGAIEALVALQFIGLTLTSLFQLLRWVIEGEAAFQ